MINCLQIIVLLPLLNSSIPPNAGIFMSYLTKIAAFDIFEIGEYAESLLELEPTDPLNPKFEAIGMESLYFINNMGSFYLALLFNLLLIPFWLIALWLGNSYIWFRKRAKKLRRHMFLNAWITTIFESIIIVALCTLITFKYCFSFSNFGHQVQSISAIFFISVYLTIPIVALLASLLKFRQATSKEMRNVFGSFYDSLNISNKRKSGRVVLLQPACFLLRRLQMAWLVIEGTQVLWYQISQVMAITGLVALLPYWLDSFKKRGEKRR